MSYPNPTVEYLNSEYTTEPKPLWFHAMGRSETASGYGRALRSSNVAVLPDGRRRRIYITQYSNSGTAWIVLGGKRLVLR